MIEPSTILALLGIFIPIAAWLIPAEAIRDLLRRKTAKTAALAIGTTGVAKMFETIASAPVVEFVLRLWPLGLGVAVGAAYWRLSEHWRLHHSIEALERARVGLAAADAETSGRVAAVDNRVIELAKVTRAFVVDDLGKRLTAIESRVAEIETRLPQRR